MRPVFLIPLVVAVACAPPESPRLDLVGPRLLGVDLLEGQERSPTAPIRLTFSKPLDPTMATVGTVVVAPFEVLGPCSVNLACPQGVCHRGRCQREIVDEPWVQDLNHPPLSVSRAERAAPVDVALGESGTTVTVRFLEPLNAERLHTLVVSAAIRDLSFNPLQTPGEEGVPLRMRFATGRPDAGQAILSLDSPPAGELDVPTNLQRVVVSFSKPVVGVSDTSLWLETVEGRRIAGQVIFGSWRCMGRPAATCFEIRLLEALPPLQSLEARASATIRDDQGQPVFEGGRRRFATVSVPDEVAPKATFTRVQVADRCVVVRVRTPEPADLLLLPSWLPAGPSTVGAMEHELALPAPGGTSGRVDMVLEDLAGNFTILPPVVLPVPEYPPRIVITEVLANPAGPEPAQEFVELYNLSPAPVDLGAWRLDDNDDGIGANLLPHAVLDPGRFAVVVGPKFSLTSIADPQPAPKALLIRLDATLGNDGLANTGEPIVLRDPHGTLVSAYGSHHAAVSKDMNGRSIERVSPSACDTRNNWRPNPEGRSTPGAAAE
jgi:hypothetical protein